MEINQIRKFNSQISRMYVLAIIHVILSAIGLMLNYCQVKSDYLFFSIVALNIVALICFQPWQIMRYLHEAYGYERLIGSMQQKRGNNV